MLEETVRRKRQTECDRERLKEWVWGRVRGERDGQGERWSLRDIMDSERNRQCKR